MHPALPAPERAAPSGDRTGADAYVALFDIYGTLHLAESGTQSGRARGIDDARPAGEPPRAVRARAGARPRRWATGLIAAAALVVGGSASAETLLNVSYDPTRELYRDYNAAFAEHWQAEGNAPIEISASHGGSGAQARAVIDGLDAQVVTLALASDVNAIAEKSGKIPADWQAKLPHKSAP